MGKTQRLEWTEGLDVKKATEEKVDVLYWVGCVASLDDRNRKVARSVATILNKAVSLLVSGPDEKCCGDPFAGPAMSTVPGDGSGQRRFSEGTGCQEDCDRLSPLLQHPEKMTTRSSAEILRYFIMRSHLHARRRGQDQTFTRTYGNDYLS